jgi:hypothetical protein
VPRVRPCGCGYMPSRPVSVSAQGEEVRSVEEQTAFSFYGMAIRTRTIRVRLSRS